MKNNETKVGDSLASDYPFSLILYRAIKDNGEIIVDLTDDFEAALKEFKKLKLLNTQLESLLAIPVDEQDSDIKFENQFFKIIDGEVLTVITTPIKKNC